LALNIGCEFFAYDIGLADRDQLQSSLFWLAIYIYSHKYIFKMKSAKFQVLFEIFNSQNLIKN
jgi:hypothetical protein